MRPSRTTRAIGVSLAVLVLLCGLCELGYRWLPFERDEAALQGFRRLLLTGEMKHYEARAYTNFQRPPEATGNAFGFQDFPRQIARTPGVPRLVCLGASTTEGGNELGLRGSYPYLLERELEKRTGRDFEVLNAGIAGWTSAEMLVSWFLTLQDFEPDVLVVHEAVNDNEARFRADYRPDYSHWRRPIQTRPAQGPERWLARWSDLYVALAMRADDMSDVSKVSTYPSTGNEPLMAEGKLPHETSLAFRRNIQNIALSARAAGHLVVLMTLPARHDARIGAFWEYGIEENNQHLRELCAEHGFLLADAARAFQARPELYEQFLDVVHVRPPGNQAKAELVADTLADWIRALPTENSRPPQTAMR